MQILLLRIAWYPWFQTSDLSVGQEIPAIHANCQITIILLLNALSKWHLYLSNIHSSKGWCVISDHQRGNGACLLWSLPASYRSASILWKACWLSGLDGWHVLLVVWCSSLMALVSNRSWFQMAFCTGICAYLESVIPNNHHVNLFLTQFKMTLIPVWSL